MVHGTIHIAVCHNFLFHLLAWLRRRFIYVLYYFLDRSSIWERNKWIYSHPRWGWIESAAYCGVNSIPCKNTKFAEYHINIFLPLCLLCCAYIWACSDIITFQELLSFQALLLSCITNIPGQAWINVVKCSLWNVTTKYILGVPKTLRIIRQDYLFNSDKHFWYFPDLQCCGGGKNNKRNSYSTLFEARSDLERSNVSSFSLYWFHAKFSLLKKLFGENTTYIILKKIMYK